MAKLKEPIELGNDEDYKTAGLASAPAPSEGVSLYLPDIGDLGKLPACGEITFRYKRNSLTLGEEDLSAQLTLCAIVAVKEIASDDEDEAPKEDAVDKLFAEAQKSESRGDDDEVETGDGQAL